MAIKPATYRDTTPRTTICRPPHAVLSRLCWQPQLRPTTPCSTGSQTPRPCPKDGLGVSFGVTPRQACPQPKGLRRNLRSKTRWFAGFCNSHQVSHFATFFIDARAEISVAESRVDYDIIAARGAIGKPTTAPSNAI